MIKEVQWVNSELKEFERMKNGVLFQKFVNELEIEKRICEQRVSALDFSSEVNLGKAQQIQGMILGLARVLDIIDELEEDKNYDDGTGNGESI